MGDKMSPPANAIQVERFLASASCKPASIINTDDNTIVLDLSRGSLALGEPLADIDVDHFSVLVDKAMADAGTRFAYGRYAEDRELYNNDHFDSDAAAESRSIHMGVDVFCTAGTPVFAPLDGTLEIMANNTRELDYGPMLILRHAADDSRFYTLYGHLSLESITSRTHGEPIRAGEQIATVGSPPTNGNWPPHLHFQLILDLLEYGKDFPGVAYPAEKAYWLKLSPSPERFFPDCDPAELNCELR